MLRLLQLKKELAEMFEKVAAEIDPTLAAKWLRRELIRVLNYNKKSYHYEPISHPEPGGWQKQMDFICRRLLWHARFSWKVLAQYWRTPLLSAMIFRI
jgi:hypothetical protein